MASTKIEWADAVWNPITGCTPISEGCDRCYARRMANRLKGRYGYGTLYPFSVTFHRDRLDDPSKWRKPRRVFVCSMGDLFHESINFRGNEIKDIFRIMAASDSTFMLLTKRPQRMAECIEYIYGGGFREQMPNVWLGVTAENQARADERIPILLQIPAAVRFVSVEPMLGPVVIDDYMPTLCFNSTALRRFANKNKPCLDWVICGGENGIGARPMHQDWVRSLRDQCLEALVPFFFKGWGKWTQNPSNAGKLILDGREWNELPV